MNITDHRTSIVNLALLAACAVLAAALLLGGCSKKNSNPVGIVIDPGYEPRATPEGVLHNVKTAYVWRNSTEYLDCLSEDFIFYPDEADVQNPDMEIPPEWYKTDEQNMHENMFAVESNVESITLTLTITEITYDDGMPGDDSDDTCVCTVDVDLRVNLFGDLTYLATAPSQYHMRTDTDQQGSGGTRLWEIYMWYDLGDQGRGGSPAVESSSWGGIKSMYKADDIRDDPASWGTIKSLYK